MRVLLIGGTGHIGHYLARHFVSRGDEVCVIARGGTATGPPGGSASGGDFWNKVRQVPLDRSQAEKTACSGGGRTVWQAAIQEIAADVVVDLIAYEAESTFQTLAAIRGRARQFINIGSGWRFGENRTLPARESDPPRPRCHYGEQKQAMWEAIERAYREDGLAGTQFDPPAIQGAPKIPNTPCGLRLIEVHREIAGGNHIAIPGSGETLLGMVHVADVAQAVILAVEQPEKAAGQAFNVTGDNGITYNGLFEWLRDYFRSGATCEHVSLDEFERMYPERTSRHHVLYHQLLSNQKAKSLLGFRPSVDLYQALEENMDWLCASGKLRAKGTPA